MPEESSRNSVEQQNSSPANREKSLKFVTIFAFMIMAHNFLSAALASANHSKVPDRNKYLCHQTSGAVGSYVKGTE